MIHFRKCPRCGLIKPRAAFPNPADRSNKPSAFCGSCYVAFGTAQEAKRLLACEALTQAGRPLSKSAQARMDAEDRAAAKRAARIREAMNCHTAGSKP
jgi:hypothetical protein